MGLRILDWFLYLFYLDFNRARANCTYYNNNFFSVYPIILKKALSY
ncbi:hypothetical protein ES332_D03G046800v1 [Gossypium tomentosum]|uniref:Uncharacterized protein n=1 Tax=Gossypium tomentosum TaxID=34277 RepID=A0A5D2LKL8_GOSTO|nr:hypothetical protein ES332_D03G046800v1 [Gossypium tomentosum]